MDSDLKQIFQKVKYQPEMKLSGDIWRLIESRSNRIYKIRMWGHSIISAVSLFLLIPTGNNLIKQFSGQGFYEYLSLVFSDFSIVVTYWREFALSLANSLPLVSIILVFTLLFVLFVSISKIVRQLKNQFLLVN